MNIPLTVPGIRFTESKQFFLLAGPCVVENYDITMKVAEHALSVCTKLEIPFIFKASYRKANRSKLDSFSGLGNQEALGILASVKEKLNVPVVTDIHTAEEAALAAEVADVLQIPAFLCRQSDLLLAAAKTGKWINIKKGQFLAPDAMKFAAEKVLSSGNKQIMLTERGSMFGYQDLVVDFRSVPQMQSTGYPVVVDITHSLQQPNQTSGVTGGQPHMIETMGRAAIAVGADGIFLETHPDPSKALSDGANMLKLEYLKQLLGKLTRIRELVVQF